MRLAYQLGQQAVMSQSSDEEISRVLESLGVDELAIAEFHRGIKEQQAVSRLYVGKLVAHGAERYQKKPRAKMSYFVTLQTDQGEQTIWGVDLRRAMAQGHVQPGEQVKLDYMGNEQVLVEAPKLDDDGNTIGTEQIQTHRNSWRVQQWNSALLTQHLPPSAASIAKSQAQSRPSGTPADPWHKLSSPAASSHRSLLGPQGMGGLAQMINEGGSIICNAISDYSFLRTERELLRVIEEAEEELDELKNAGLDQLEYKELDSVGKADFAAAFFASEERQKQLSSIAKRLDTAQKLSERLLKKGIDKELDPNSLMSLSIDPLHKFMKDNDVLLQNMHHEGQSLFDRVSNGIQGLVSAVTRLIASLSSSIQNTTSSRKVSDPQLGG